MKKIFLFMLAAFMFTSCDSFKGSKNNDDDTEEESPKKKKKKNADDDDNKGTKDDDDDDDDNNNNNDDDDIETNNNDDEDNDEDTDVLKELNWTGQDRKLFVTECADEAAKKLGEDGARAYCACMLFQIERKFSSYSEANKKMTKNDLNTMAAKCNQ